MIFGNKKLKKEFLEGDVLDYLLEIFKEMNDSIDWIREDYNEYSEKNPYSLNLQYYKDYIIKEEKAIEFISSLFENIKTINLVLTKNGKINLKPVKEILIKKLNVVQHPDFYEFLFLLEFYKKELYKFFQTKIRINNLVVDDISELLYEKFNNSFLSSFSILTGEKDNLFSYRLSSYTSCMYFQRFVEFYHYFYLPYFLNKEPTILCNNREKKLTPVEFISNILNEKYESKTIKIFLERNKQFIEKNIKSIEERFPGFMFYRTLESHSRNIEEKYIDSISKKLYSSILNNFFEIEEVELDVNKYKQLLATEEPIRFEYVTTTGNNVLLYSDSYSEETIKKGLRCVNVFYSFVNKRGVTNTALDKINMIYLYENEANLGNTKNSSAKGLYFHSGYERNTLALNIRKNDNIKDCVVILIHEFGHLIHFNASPQAQGFWRDYHFKQGEKHPISPELDIEMPEKERGDYVVNKKFKNPDYLPTNYSKTNLKEAFAEVFLSYMVQPNSLSQESKYAIRKFLSLSNFYNDNVKSYIHEQIKKEIFKIIKNNFQEKQ